MRFHDILGDDMGTLMDEQDQLLYSLFNAGQICDFILSMGIKPFVEMSFMPSTLASGEETVFHYSSNVTPPVNDTEWAQLVCRLLSHWVERYGIDEVSAWYFEVNLKSFWTGDREERMNYGFLIFCKKNKAPVNFISTHHCPTRALGSVGEDTEKQLAQGKRSVLRKWARETHRKVKGGFGLLTLQGVAKAAYRAFELLHRLGVGELSVRGKSKTVDVWTVSKCDAVTVLVTHIALPRHSIKAESLYVELSGLQSPRNVYIERIDDPHANAKRLWIEMGKPALPTEREVKQLHVASQIVREPLSWQFEMPQQDIRAITVELSPKSTGQSAKI